MRKKPFTNAEMVTVTDFIETLERLALQEQTADPVAVMQMTSLLNTMLAVMQLNWMMTQNTDIYGPQWLKPEGPEVEEE